jgi:alpha-beta hydrolase superfamily lysophospholipase
MPAPLRAGGELQLAVTRLPGLPGGTWIAATLHAPPREVAPSGALLICSPGGTYARSCADLAVPGRSGYSMAAHLTARGHYVLAVDTLGTGSSAAPPNGDLVTMDTVARALADAASAASRLLAEAGGGRIAVIGLGHSLGGAVTVAAQSLAEPFAAVAVLGYSPAWRSVPSAGSAGTSAAALRPAVLTELTAADPALWSSSYVRFGREATRDFSHWPDVPADVVLAADGDQVAVPRGLAADFGMTGPAGHAAARVRVPLFLGFGERDVTDRPHAEPGHYPASRDVTLHVLAGSGHCQYTASGRQQLWNRLDQWITTVIASREDTHGQPAGRADGQP